MPEASRGAHAPRPPLCQWIGVNPEFERELCLLQTRPLPIENGRYRNANSGAAQRWSASGSHFSFLEPSACFMTTKPWRSWNLRAAALAETPGVTHLFHQISRPPIEAAPMPRTYAYGET